MAVLNAMGWSIAVSPITGKVVISRQGIHGQVELPHVDDMLCVRIVDENDNIVATAMEHSKNMRWNRDE